jgi:hypothetical protein
MTAPWISIPVEVEGQDIPPHPTSLRYLRGKTLQV